jgi:predicted amidohydrolase
MAQLLVEGGEPARNLQRAEKLIRQAKAELCDLVLLPETLDLGWTHPSVYNESEPIPGARSDFFCALARQLKIWICLGLTEKEDNHFFNTAILIDDNGEILHKYRKINLLVVEHPFYRVGQSLSVVDTKFGKIGINICADNYLDSLHIGHVLGRMGAQLIISPASWTVDYSITEEVDPYKDKWIKPFSILNSYYEIPVVSVTSVGYIVGGPYEGKKMVGRSLAIDREGNITQGLFNEFAGELKAVDLEIPEPRWKGTQIGEMLLSKGYRFDELLLNKAK